MFVNTTIRRGIEEIRAELKAVGLKKREVEDKLFNMRRDYKITDNKIRRRYSAGNTIPEEVWQEREVLSKQITEFNKQLSELRLEFNQEHIKEDAEKNIALMGVFKEIFNDAQRKEIMEEIDRRRKGESPIPLGLDFKELDRYKNDYHKFRNFSKEQLEKMIEFRIALTGLIEQGCNQFGNAEFLKFISPLNRLIIPLEELRKIKQKFLL